MKHQTCYFFTSEDTKENMMKITKAVVRRMSLDFKVGFRTSFGLSTTKDFSIVELHDSDGNVGYGACSAFMRPW